MWAGKKLTKYKSRPPFFLPKEKVLVYKTIQLSHCFYLLILWNQKSAVYEIDLQNKHKIDRICEKGSFIHNYKYLETQI